MDQNPNSNLMATYYDIHNHLFNKRFLAKELLYRLLKEMKMLLQPDDEEKRQRGLKDMVKKIKTIINLMRRYAHAIRVFSLQDSTAIYEELDKTYQGDFILTPLTFDLTWCFASTPDRDDEPAKEPDLREMFDNELEELVAPVERDFHSAVRDPSVLTNSEHETLWEDYLLQKDLFTKSISSLCEKPEANTGLQQRGGVPSDLPDLLDGFNEQIRQLTEMKKNPAYKDKIYPFLAVDPRRPDIEAYAKKNVGKGKLFVGIKLYCSNGYSPTDPLLFGPDGVRGGIYAFCEDNGIPITAHNSSSGFATLSNSVVINGLVHLNGQLTQKNKEHVIFKKAILEKQAAYERATILNHPLLWAKVVEKYPDLILNLAHFGGGEELNGALDNLERTELWSNRIIALIKNSKNVYTDLSCHTDFDVLEKLANSPVFGEIKTKIMYGSDFTLMLLFEDDFNRNVSQFKQIFGDKFPIIAHDNPERFLAHVLP
jgi:predicted TIM-barrel fold metal-dependent hydrolase